MLICLVVLGPILGDRLYQTGEEITLSTYEANLLASFGIVEILEPQPVAAAATKSSTKAA